MSDNKNLTHNSKKDFLKNPVEHIDITSFDARKIISSMEKMSFVSRETANAAGIFNEMIQDKDCTIFLTLAGSTSAAGCMNIYMKPSVGAGVGARVSFAEVGSVDG